MSAWLEPLETGSRCSKWKLRWSRGSRGGKRQRSMRFDGTKREAQSALKAFAEKCEKRKGSTTFSGYSRKWNDGRLESGAVNQATHDKHKWLLGALSLHLGDMDLREVGKRDVESAYKALRESGCRGTRGWSGTSLRTAHISAQAMFDAAVEDGLCESNPFRQVDPPKPDTKERKALSVEGSAGLLSALGPLDEHEFAVSMMLRTGLRSKEALGVTWNDVSEDGVEVSRENTKTDSGVRFVPFDEHTSRYVAARKRAIEARLGMFGDKLDGSEKMCCGSDGRPLTYNALRRWWERHRAEYGMDGWTLHELRHTFLTNLAQSGVHPSVMQRLAGHSRMNVTMEIYTHAQREDLQKAVQTLGSARNVPPNVPPSDT